MNQEASMIFPVIGAAQKALPFYITGIGINHTQEHVDRGRGHRDYQWVQTLKGAGILKIDNEEYSIKEGMGMLLYPNEKHEYYSEYGEWRVNWITFNGYGVEGLLANNKLTKTDAYYIMHPYVLAGEIRSIYHLYSNNLSNNRHSVLNGVQGSKVLYELLLNIINLNSKEKEQSHSTYLKRLEPVLHFMEQNYNKPVMLGELSSLLGISEGHFCRLFKQSVGARPIQYVNTIRISKAKELLLAKESMAVKDIAEEVGFEDVNYFCYIFKSLADVTPTEFRGMH
ncbi:MAG: transcriptional regulator, AraC family [Clostridia bacterium]|jgi:AraC-like DNA-binding protein|nr:transcriptional regulator, AraC family [Clostridia bacterium]